MFLKLFRNQLFLIWATFLLPQAALASAEEAKNFIESISQNVLSVIKEQSLSSEQKESRLEQLFKDSVDTGWVSRFVMGRYWRKANDEQKSKYTEVYTKFLTNSYVPRFKEYTNQELVLKKFYTEEPDEFLIQTEIIADDSAPVRVDYKVRKIDEASYKIFDVIAEGISLITTQRSEFSSILSRKGIDYLIERLEARIQ